MRVQARRNNGVTVLFAALIATAGLWFVVSQHAANRGTGELWSAERIFETLEEAINDPGRGPCRQLIVASCPNALVRDPGSPRYGMISPQVRVYCQLSDSSGIMGVFGWYNRIGITAYALRLDRFYKICALDSCETKDITWLQEFLAGW